LVNALREGARDEVTSASQLPSDAEYIFDAQSSSCEPAPQSLPIEKTRVRTVVSMEFSAFLAKEVMRRETSNEVERKTVVHRSAELASIVPRGGRYAYDLIASVGCRTFLEGWRQKEIQEQLPTTRSGTPMPTSSIHDAQHKFLFYFGELHRQAAPRIAEYLRECGNTTWLVDGTLEPGTPVFFGVKEAREGIMLGSWRIPTENEDDIARCLTEAKLNYGPPHRILRDLSERVAQGCRIALSDVPQFVCHYHFARDVGADLYEEPQNALSKRLRAMKLQVRLKDQRSGQTQRLRKALESSDVSLVLTDLLDGNDVSSAWNATLGSEILLAFQSWMLDYARDGKRQGFPFDPYLLYFHRRIEQIQEALERLLGFETVRQQAPKTLFNFADRLDRYLADPVIDQASTLYEKAFAIFQRLRAALRFTPIGPDPMAEGYELEPYEQQLIEQSLRQLREQFGEEMRTSTNAEERDLYDIANTHLDRYGPFLLPVGLHQPEHDCTVRTTSNLERHWWDAKRVRRQTNGRKKLTRDFNALPAEFMLVPNLRIPTYVELVLGSLDQLPAKLAEAGKTAGPFSHWRRKNKPLNIGRLPRRLLRTEDFVEKLIDVCVEQS